MIKIQIAIIVLRDCKAYQSSYEISADNERYEALKGYHSQNHRLYAKSTLLYKRPWKSRKSKDCKCSCNMCEYKPPNCCTTMCLSCKKSKEKETEEFEPEPPRPQMALMPVPMPPPPPPNFVMMPYPMPYIFPIKIRERESIDSLEDLPYPYPYITPHRITADRTVITTTESTTPKQKTPELTKTTETTPTKVTTTKEVTTSKEESTSKQVTTPKEVTSSKEEQTSSNKETPSNEESPLKEPNTPQYMKLRTTPTLNKKCNEQEICRKKDRKSYINFQPAPFEPRSKQLLLPMPDDLRFRPTIANVKGRQTKSPIKVPKYGLVPIPDEMADKIMKQLRITNGVKSIIAV